MFEKLVIHPTTALAFDSFVIFLMKDCDMVLVGNESERGLSFYQKTRPEAKEHSMIVFHSNSVFDIYTDRVLIVRSGRIIVDIDRNFTQRLDMSFKSEDPVKNLMLIYQMIKEDEVKEKLNKSLQMHVGHALTSDRRTSIEHDLRSSLRGVSVMDDIDEMNRDMRFESWNKYLEKISDVPAFEGRINIGSAAIPEPIRTSIDLNCRCIIGDEKNKNIKVIKYKSDNVEIVASNKKYNKVKALELKNICKIN